MKTPALLLLSLIAAVGLGGCVNRAAQAQAKKTEAILKDPEIPVKVMTLEAGNFADTIDLTGALTTSDDSMVGAEAPGKIVAVYVKEGDSVVAGQALAKQSTEDSLTRQSQARSQLDAALAQLRQAQNEASVGPARSASAVRAARAQLAQAEAQLLKARNGSRKEERRQAEAQVNAAKVNLEVTKKQMERGQGLYAEGAISEREYDAYRQAYAGALAQYESALEAKRLVDNAVRAEDITALESQVRGAREQLQTALANQRLDAQYADRVSAARAQVESAQRQIDLTQIAIEVATIKAPFSGRIASKPAQPGAYLGPGSPLLRIVGSEGIYFEADVPESQVGAVKPGANVSVSLPAMPNRFMAGKVVSVNPSAESTGRIYKVRVRLDSVPADVKVGMFVKAKLETKREENVITVPLGAVVSGETESYVFIIRDGKAVKRAVQMGSRSAGRVVITGVEAGEQIAITGQSQLRADTPVRIEK